LKKMLKISDVFMQALLTDASYVDDLRRSEVSGPALENRMTPELANLIRSNFAVIAQINTSESLSGFDATVWRGLTGENTGRIFITMRGTEGEGDLVNDVLLSLPTKIAYYQIVDMIDWWKQITSPAGVPIVKLNGDANTGTGELYGVTNVTVTGHSLGGHLASSFARLFGRSVTIDAVSTFNSAGFAPFSELSFAPLETSLGVNVSLGRFLQESQVNYFGYNGINLTTNTAVNQIGQRVGLFNEESPYLIPNHFMFKLTDALLLGNAMFKLDPSLTDHTPENRIS
jgi:hypothetical protein